MGPAAKGSWRRVVTTRREGVSRAARAAIAGFLEKSCDCCDGRAGTDSGIQTVCPNFCPNRRRPHPCVSWTASVAAVRRTRERRRRGYARLARVRWRILHRKGTLACRRLGSKVGRQGTRRRPIRRRLRPPVAETRLPGVGQRARREEVCSSTMRHNDSRFRVGRSITGFGRVVFRRFGPGADRSACCCRQSMRCCASAGPAGRRRRFLNRRLTVRAAAASSRALFERSRAPWRRHRRGPGSPAGRSGSSPARSC
jgi:hypothetical protein